MHRSNCQLESIGQILLFQSRNGTYFWQSVQRTRVLKPPSYQKILLPKRADLTASSNCQKLGLNSKDFHLKNGWLFKLFATFVKYLSFRIIWWKWEPCVKNFCEIVIYLGCTSPYTYKMYLNMWAFPFLSPPPPSSRCCVLKFTASFQCHQFWVYRFTHVWP